MTSPRPPGTPSWEGIELQYFLSQHFRLPRSRVADFLEVAPFDLLDVDGRIDAGEDILEEGSEPVPDVAEEPDQGKAGVEEGEEAAIAGSKRLRLSCRRCGRSRRVRPVGLCGRIV